MTDAAGPPATATAHPFTVVLLDLDGTLIDSAPGIVESLAWVLERVGAPVPPHEQLLHWVGPPVLDSFREFAGLPDEVAVRAVELYRDHYRERGARTARLFPGVREMLQRIRAAGIPLSLATSKPEPLARSIVEREGLLELLAETTGAEDGSRETKADVVAEALRRLTARGLDVARPVLVGDRHHDVEGAAEHDVPTIFAGWGYGGEAESAGAWATAAHPHDVLALLGVPSEVSSPYPPKEG